MVLSVLTIRKGLLGIAAFLCAVLPHGLVYLCLLYTSIVFLVLKEGIHALDLKIHLNA